MKICILIELVQLYKNWEAYIKGCIRCGSLIHSKLRDSNFVLNVISVLNY